MTLSHLDTLLNNKECYELRSQAQPTMCQAAAIGSLNVSPTTLLIFIQISWTEVW